MNDGFVLAYDPNGNRRHVPKHYLDNPRFGYRLTKPPAPDAESTTETPADKAAGDKKKGS